MMLDDGEVLTPDHHIVGVDQHSAPRREGPKLPSVTPSIKVKPKGSNATYIAQVDVNPDGEFALTQAEPSDSEHAFAEVNVAWYGTDRIKLTIKGAGPAVIRQAYLTGAGQDVILDLITLPGGEA
jgi:hypothetical protein